MFFFSSFLSETISEISHDALQGIVGCIGRADMYCGGCQGTRRRVLHEDNGRNSVSSSFKWSVKGSALTLFAGEVEWRASPRL